MTDTPKQIWAWPYIESRQDDLMKGGWNDEPERRETQYHRADLSADLVRAALEAAAVDAYEGCAETRHVTLADKVEKSILALASNPEAVAAIVAQVMEKE